MKNLFKKREVCRLCGNNNLDMALSIGESPVAEKYELTKKKAKSHQFVSLDLYFCNRCYHVQLIHIIDPDYLWSDFTFKTGNKDILVEHIHEEVKKIMLFSGIQKDDYVIDVGSNDGTLLKCFKDNGINNIIGVEPVYEIANEAIKNGVETINEYMNMNTAKKLLNRYNYAKIVTAFNVYAHADDLEEMTKAIQHILAKNGLFIFEVSYLLNVINKMLIGTIFHEHLSYHSVVSIDRFLSTMDLELINVYEADEQGGSLIGYAQHKGGPFDKNISITKYINNEIEFGIDKLSTFNVFQKKLNNLKNSIHELINNINKENKTLAAYGAARSGATLMSFFDLGSFIEFIVDDNKEKHHKYSPGHGVKVLSSDAIYDIKPDYMFILAWMHSEAIINNNIPYLVEGGKFIEIHPDLRIIDINTLN